MYLACTCSSLNGTVKDRVPTWQAGRRSLLVDTKENKCTNCGRWSEQKCREVCKMLEGDVSGDAGGSCCGAGGR